MMTTTRLLTVLSILALPALASAQTLMVEVDQPLVVAPAQAPMVMQPPQDAPLVQEAPAGDDCDINATIGLGLWVEMMSLDASHFTLREPEISALTGVELGQDWQGQSVLAAPVITGAMFSLGMRADDWVRGPELRFFVGGTDLAGESALAPGGSGMELSIQQALVLRAELALGIQAPLGPFHPYVQARVSVGGAFVEVAATDPRLGALGSESVDDLLLEVGVEAGASYDVGDGIELGAAFRAGINQNGDESIGGMLTLTVVGGD